VRVGKVVGVGACGGADVVDVTLRLGAHLSGRKQRRRRDRGLSAAPHDLHLLLSFVLLLHDGRAPADSTCGLRDPWCKITKRAVTVRERIRNSVVLGSRRTCKAIMMQGIGKPAFFTPAEGDRGSTSRGWGATGGGALLSIPLKPCAVARFRYRQRTVMRSAVPLLEYAMASPQ